MAGREEDLEGELKALRRRVEEFEKASSEEAEKFRTLTVFSPVGMFLDAPDGRAIYINRKCAELVGMPAEDALSFDWIPAIHPDDRERVIAARTKRSRLSGPERRSAGADTARGRSCRLEMDGE